MILFLAGLVLGLVLAWLLVSWFYYEHLKRRGLIDDRGRWIDPRQPTYTLPVDWQEGAFETMAEQFPKPDRGRGRVGGFCLWTAVTVAAFLTAGFFWWVALMLIGGV